MQLQTWGQVDQLLWSQNFSRATLHQANQGALSIGPYGSQDSELSKAVKGAPVKPTAEHWTSQPLTHDNSPSA